MLRKLLSFLICFYAILFIFGIEKAYGDVNDHSLQENQYLLNKKIYNYGTELGNICQAIMGIMQTLRNPAEASLVGDIGNKCSEATEFLSTTLLLFKIYYLINNDDDRSRISTTMNNYIAYAVNRMEGNGQYINKVLTLSNNYNVVLTGGRLKNKIAEINEDMKKIRFK